MNGQGVPQDFVKAFEWSSKAANQDDAIAQRNVGTLYENGSGMGKPDYTKAAAWYAKSAAQGFSGAQIALALLLHKAPQGIPQNCAKAVELYTAAASGGRMAAYINLGHIYLHGLGGVPVNYDKAYNSYKMAADNNYSIAHYFLGLMFESGLGVGRDPRKAKECFHNALRDQKALFSLAESFEQGSMVEKNPARAKVIYVLLATSGYKDALSKVNLLDEVLNMHAFIYDRKLNGL